MLEPVRIARPFGRDYLLGEVLGTGGMGVVYSAIQLSLGCRVAIKFPHLELAGNVEVNRRFRAEAVACGRVHHRNIARVIDFNGSDGVFYLVMEHVGGIPLDKLVLEHGPMDTTVAAELCGQLLAGLHAAHTAGIVHADIKTGNVLVETLPDGTKRAVVIDFGLARFSDDVSSEPEVLLSGTPEYLAPEVIRGGGPTVASDIYAAGVVLYELLTGRTPFAGGTSSDILARQCDDAPVLPSLRSPEQTIPLAVEADVMRALAKDPAARFATAAQFAAALRATTRTPRITPRAIARGTQSRLFTAETPTLNRTRQLTPIPTAGPSEQRDRISKLRSVVGVALASGDSDAIVTSYLELVRAMIVSHLLTAAIGELEQGLARLRPDFTGESTPAATWRLQLCLAALYSSRGDGARAKLAALMGQDDAVQAASVLGQDRALALLVRLAREARPKG
jgi:serine/threonine-protein kinase